MLKIYNTLSRKIEEFKPINPPKVGFYSCGPTVYDFQHIGNYRTYVGNDILERVLKFSGYEVLRVMNITDVGHLTSNADMGEDKMEKGAKREGKTVWQIAEFYTNDFLASLKLLNIITPDVICKATNHIPEMIELIKLLEKNGYTYRITDGIYFDTAKLKDYGKLAKLDKKGLMAGARVEMVAGKKSPTDFALWKFSPKDSKRQMEWESPWGVGFPGWHIECSAMAMKYLGETFDIHSGGIDHIPVHHSNEIAQSEAATGKQFARYWVHFGHLFVDGEKMSKSLGNFYTANDIYEKGFDLLTLRYLYLNTHYRASMNFTWKSLGGAKVAVRRLRENVLFWKKNANNEIVNEKYLRAFSEKIDDDLNISTALSVLWQMVDDQKLSPEEKLGTVKKMDAIFGLDLLNYQEQAIPEEVESLRIKLDGARKNMNWKKSDSLREQIDQKGFQVENTASGTVVKRK